MVLEINCNSNKYENLREDQIEFMKYKIQLEEVTNDNIKVKLKESLSKRKKLMKEIGEIQKLIEMLEEKSGSKELKGTILEIIIKNKNLKKKIKEMKVEQDHTTIILSEVEDEKGNTILEGDQGYTKVEHLGIVKIWKCRSFEPNRVGPRIS